MTGLHSQNRVAARDEYDADAGSRRFLNLGTISVSWLVMLVCVHIMYVGFVLYGSKPQSQSVLATLTLNGKEYYLPEREIPIYVLGCALAVILSVTVGLSWRYIANLRDELDPAFAHRGTISCLLLAVLATGANVAWLLVARGICILLHASLPALTIILAAPAAIEAALLYDSQRSKPTALMLRFLTYFETELSELVKRIDRAKDKVRKHEVRTQGSWIDLAAIVLIFLLIYIPRTDLLAGLDFHLQAFHHWDFFAMGPAIGLLKGKALATQVYSQYGIGWPLLLTKLDPVIQLSYGHTYKIAVIYGCIYFSGLYWLLRKLLPSPAWALAGVLLALRIQVFHGAGTDPPLWCLPSASILRTPCDVWVFLALLAHWRSQKPIWLILAGGIVGISLLFVIDTGVYLTLTFVACNLLWLVTSHRGAVASGQIRSIKYTSQLATIAASFVACILVLISGLYTASGPSIFQPGYVHHWLEVLWLYPSGISMLPMIQDPLGVLWSYWFVVLFLGHVCAGLIRSLVGTEKSEEPLIVCMSLLGLFYLIYYIGRSHPYLIFQLSVPFCIVIVWTAQRLACTLRLRLAAAKPVSVQSSFCAVALAGMVVLIVNPQFRTYPNMLRAVFKPAPRDIECYVPELRDVCVTPKQRPQIGPFVRTVAEMKQMTANAKSFAVIADDDTSLYVASRSTLWNRYSPLLPPLMTKSMLNEVDEDLSGRPVDFVFLLKQDPDTFKSHPFKWRIMHTSDCWAQLAATTRRRYHFDHICGAYEVWRR